VTGAESPSGLQTPDGALRLQEAGRADGEALKIYHLALSRFNDFILVQNVPDANLSIDKGHCRSASNATRI